MQVEKGLLSHERVPQPVVPHRAEAVEASISTEASLVAESMILLLMRVIGCCGDVVAMLVAVAGWQ